MTQSLQAQDLKNILDGACILGCGGGGPYWAGQQLSDYVLQSVSSVTMVQPGEVNDSVWLGVAAGIGTTDIGSQLRGKHANFKIPEAPIHDVFQLLDTQNKAKNGASELKYVLPLEMGAGNTL